MVVISYKWEPIEDLPADWQRFHREDLGEVHAQWKKEKSILKDPTKIHQLEDRLATEWAIETGILERLYVLDRGVTETLIELGMQALQQYSSRGVITTNAANLIEDQRGTLELLFRFINQGRNLTDSYIQELHQALTLHQPSTMVVDQFGKKFQTELLRGVWKKLPNNPTRPDGAIHEYCPPEFVQDEIDQLLVWHKEHIKVPVPPEIEAAWFHHRFTQIHPFQDGNGRVARALATLIFLREEYLPLVVRDTQHRERYLTALENADIGDLSQLVGLFTDIQVSDLTKAIEFLRTLRGESLVNIASSAAERAKRLQMEQREEEQQLTSKLLGVAENRLLEVEEELRQQFAAQKVKLDILVEKSKTENETWWSVQIVEMAKLHGYWADLSKSRRWVQLKLGLPELGIAFTHIVVSFHGRNAIAGFMVANAFLTTTAGTGAEEGWEIFSAAEQPYSYSLSRKDPEKGFAEWLDKAIEAALDHWQSRI